MFDFGNFFGGVKGLIVGLIEIYCWVVVARGVEGALGAYRQGGVHHFCEQPAWMPEKACEPTGCGDVFLAGLGAGLYNCKGLPEAMNIATRAAGLNSRLQGIEALKQLEELQLN